MAGKTVAWRKRLLGAIASGLLLAGTVSATASLAADAAPAAVAQKVENHGDLWAKLAADPDAKVPVIVRFNMPALPDAASFASPAAADEAQTRAIHALQDNILGAVLPAGTLSSAQATSERNLKRMDFSPMFGILANADDLARLAANPNVTMIQEDIPVPPSLIQSLPLIQMPSMYSAGATGNGYRVAVLDTGARRSHQFLSSRIISEACYNTSGVQGSVSRCPGGAESSTATGSGEDCTSSNVYGCGHGTHVAGTAAGFNTSPQSGQPANGVARDARIIAINVFSQFPAGSGTPCGVISGYTHCVLTFTSDQISGLERVYALRNSMNIASVNMSLGGGQHFSHCDGDSRKPIIDQLKSAGIATVIAAGNEYLPDEVGAPGCISSAVTVGSATKSDVKSDFSNWGTLIDVVAPGSDILASYINGSSNSQFSYLSGTSMASPHVAGAFAALRDAHPTATVNQIENALKSTGTSISAHGVTKPRINVNSARLAIGGDPDPTGPANDNFADSKAITALPSPGAVRAVTGSNVEATDETGEPYHAGRTSARTSVWWRFRPSVSGQMTLSTVGSSFDTVLAVYTGSAVNALTEVASNDDAGSTLQSRVNFDVTAGTLYRVAVAGYNNATGNIKLNMRIVVPAPENDNFASSKAITVLPPPGSIRAVLGTNVAATAETGEPYHASVTSARNSVWWRFRPSTSGQIVLSTVGSNFDTVLAIYTGSAVNSLTAVASNNNISGSTTQSRVAYNATAGTLYYVAIAGVSNAEGNVRLNIRGGGSSISSVEVTGTASVGFDKAGNATSATAGAAPAAMPASMVASLSSPATVGIDAQRLGDGKTGPAAIDKSTGQTPASPVATTAPVDLVSTVVTPSNDGILRVPHGGGSVAVLAVNNAGTTAATLTAQLSLSPADGASAALPDGLSICRTDASTGACIGSRGLSVTFTAEPGEVVTFAAFVSHHGQAIALDPTANRLHVHFRQQGNTVGTASLPFCTADAEGCASEDVSLNAAQLKNAL